MNPYNRACRIRIRPDLGTRVVPGWPWMPREAWLARRQFMKDNAKEILV